MCETSVIVKISKRDDCVFESSLKISPENDLNNLITKLKETQRKVNGFLTHLVEAERTDDFTKDEFDEADSEDESIVDNSADDRDRVDPKKCKFSD